MTNAESPESRPRANSSPNERITDQARILSILKGLLDNRALLSARAGHDDTYYNTTLLRLDPEGGVLYLDELAPREGHERLAAGFILHLYGVLNRIPAHFTCSIEHIGEQNGIAFYRTPLPEAMDYQQKRAHVRVHVGLDTELLVHLRLEDGQRITGQLQDISLGGFSARMRNDSPIATMDAVTIESLQLPGRDPIACKGQIRHVHPDRDRLHIGVRLLDLTPQAERALLRSILELEREQIRRQTRG